MKYFSFTSLFGALAFSALVCFIYTICGVKVCSPVGFAIITLMFGGPFYIFTLPKS